MFERMIEHTCGESRNEEWKWPDHEQFMHVSMSCITPGAAGRGMHKNRRARCVMFWSSALPHHDAMPATAVASKATSSTPSQSRETGQPSDQPCLIHVPALTHGDGG